MAIMFLGAVTFAGLRSTPLDMKLSADTYFDNNSLMDVKIQNTLGIMQEDIDTVKSLKYVETAEGSYTVDAYLQKGNENYIIKVLSLSSAGVNAPTLISGELPASNDECVVEKNIMDLFRLKIGDKITVSTDEGTYKDSLKISEFKITGIISSPIYMAFERGTSTIGNGLVTGYIMVNEEDFNIAAFTEMYVKLKGADKLDCFGDTYKDYVAKSVASLKDVMSLRAETRADEIEMIAGATIDDAVAQLHDGEYQIQQGENDLSAGQRQLEIARQQLAQGKQDLAQGEIDLAAARAQIAKSEQDLAAGWVSYNTQIADGERQLAEGYQQLIAGQAQVDQGKRDLAAELAKWDSLVQQYGSRTIASINQEVAQGERDLANGAAQLEEGRQRLEQYASYSNTSQYQEGLRQYQEGLRQYQEGLARLNANRSNVEYLNSFGYPSSYTVLQVREAERQRYQKQIDEGQAQVNAGWVDYNNGLKQLEEGRANGLARLNQAQRDLDQAKQEYAARLQEYRDGQQQVADGEVQISQGEEQVASGKTQLEEAYEKYEEGEQEYLEGLDLLAKLQALKSTSYVNDRTINPGYSNFELDCQRIAALSNVFPLIFFLVAALVALTTMTRMVDVKRTEIGAMRTMGFSGTSIGLSFIFYGLLASVLGTGAGFFVGSQLLPRIIINAYKALYSIPKTAVSYNYGYLAFCLIFGTSLVLAATIWGTISILRESPAKLSMPKAPIPGKRILLERMRFLWKHLRFRTKVMFRNIFRYKKRLVLTVIGLAGTAALIITAFGLQDSVDAIAGVQFGELNKSDLVVYMSDSSTPEVKATALQKIESDPNVTGSAALYGKYTSVVGGAAVENAVFYATPIDPAKFAPIMVLRNRVTKQSLPLIDGQCVITEKMAELLDLSVGDEIEFDLEGKNVKLPISGICENYAGHFIFLSPATFQQYTSTTPNFNLVYVTVDKGISETATELLKTPGISMLFYVDSSLKYYENSIQGVNVAVLIIIYSAACLAFVVIYNLNNITITERMRELATLKVLGYYDFDVSKYLYRENFILTFLGIAFGQVLGYFLFRYLVKTIETSVVMFGRKLEPSSLLYSIALTLLFAITVNAITHFRLKKIDMVDSLKMPD